MQQETLIRHPRKEDGLTVYNLIKNSPPLDLNSIYYYYIMCSDFAETSIVAEQNGEIIGYISGYIPPNDKGTLFIWQVAVSEAARGKGLATTLLSSLVSELKDRAGLSQLKTTISPSNTASQTLFLRFSQTVGVTPQQEPYLQVTDFSAGEGHEAETLYTINLK